MPQKQQMAGRLGASISELSFQINLTLGNPTKERRGTKNSWPLHRKSAINWLVARTIDRHASSYIMEARKRATLIKGSK